MQSARVERKTLTHRASGIRKPSSSPYKYSQLPAVQSPLGRGLLMRKVHWFVLVVLLRHTDVSVSDQNEGRMLLWFIFDILVLCTFYSAFSKGTFTFFYYEEDNYYHYHCCCCFFIIRIEYNVSDALQEVHTMTDSLIKNTVTNRLFCFSSKVAQTHTRSELN